MNFLPSRASVPLAVVLSALLVPLCSPGRQVPRTCDLSTVSAFACAHGFILTEVEGSLFAGSARRAVNSSQGGPYGVLRSSPSLPPRYNYHAGSLFRR